MSSRSNGVTKVRLSRSTSSRVTRSPSCSDSLISRTRLPSSGNSSRSRASCSAIPTAFADARRARKLGCDAIEILVTSPGRQAANGAELVATLEAATGIRPHVLSSDEEGALAWHGAVNAAQELPETVAVCDVGGGSTQLVVGTVTSGPAWARSIDVGSLRLTRRVFAGDPPRTSEIARARTEVAAALGELAP